ncbi:Aste57867_16220 [Aphanomyces stellatus]|uniref:Aste57867_16220 protein n=1 Tax=Aphanomyces stellatus TaxID=120398 RepID=A0A485L571_9STRA|nr:hypothetical protein As57867_016163 [Aphanomyces stellatus]VFT92998.1 Aste57867_16220 [Aphanomyces stellatus]
MILDDTRWSQSMPYNTSSSVLISSALYARVIQNEEATSIEVRCIFSQSYDIRIGDRIPQSSSSPSHERRQVAAGSVRWTFGQLRYRNRVHFGPIALDLCHEARAIVPFEQLSQPGVPVLGLAYTVAASPERSSLQFWFQPPVLAAIATEQLKHSVQIVTQDNRYVLALEAVELPYADTIEACVARVQSKETTGWDLFVMEPASSVMTMFGVGDSW